MNSLLLLCYMIVAINASCPSCQTREVYLNSIQYTFSFSASFKTVSTVSTKYIDDTLFDMYDTIADDVINESPYDCDISYGVINSSPIYFPIYNRRTEKELGNIKLEISSNNYCYGMIEYLRSAKYDLKTKYRPIEASNLAIALICCDIVLFCCLSIVTIQSLCCNNRAKLHLERV